MNKSENLRDRLQYQTHLVLRKILKKKNSKEVSNADVALMLCQYNSASVQNDHDSIENLEPLREALSNLYKYEMQIITMYHWEGKTFEEIGRNFNGKTKNWAKWRLEKIYEKIKKMMR